ncbi:hypothetical protein Tco_1519349 [Tanacetum coccineum]
MQLQGAQENHKAEVHHSANVGAVIKKTRVPGQEGAEGNATKRYRGDNNMAALGVAASEIWVTKGLLDEAKEIILGMEIFSIQSVNTMRVSRLRFSNGMSVQILLGGHSMLLLEGGLSGNRDEEKKSKGEVLIKL